MKNLLWFHAFNRNSVAEVVDVFRNGPSTNPNPCTTQANEDALGIPRSVYAYLGKTVPHFGNVAFALRLDALAGDVSPFDTGGLVKYHQPVAGWTAAERSDFLNAFTWQSSQLPARLADYPSAQPGHLENYLRGVRPLHDGPHAVWRAHVPVAAIWSHTANTWQAWTWELRAKGQLPAPSTLEKWSCPAAMETQITEYADTTSPDEATFIEALLGKYVRGGVSQLVAELREGQAL
jgi:hypothetical protein